MTPHRLYAALLMLYPKAFRDEFGPAVIDAFRELHAASHRSPLAFWRLILADLAHPRFASNSTDVAPAHGDTRWAGWRAAPPGSAPGSSSPTGWRGPWPTSIIPISKG